jgi:hypothetical protein
VPYAALVSTFEKIEATTKRLEILEILTQFLLVVAKRDTATQTKDSNLLKVVYLCINRVSFRRLILQTSQLTVAVVSRLHGDRAGHRRDVVGQSHCRKHGLINCKDQG